MYICICNAIRESDLRQAAANCDGDVERAYASLGKVPNCGQCLVKADDIIEEEIARGACEQVAV